MLCELDLEGIKKTKMSIRKNWDKCVNTKHTFLDRQQCENATLDSRGRVLLGIEVSSSLYQLLPAPENRVGTRKPVSEHSRNILTKPASRRALVRDRPGTHTENRGGAGLRWELGSPPQRRVMRTLAGEKTRAGRRHSTEALQDFGYRKDGSVGQNLCLTRE